MIPAALPAPLAASADVSTGVQAKSMQFLIIWSIVHTAFSGKWWFTLELQSSLMTYNSGASSWLAVKMFPSSYSWTHSEPLYCCMPTNTG